MGTIAWLKHLIEYVEGAQDEPPPRLRLPLSSPLWGVW